jgi:hypothetical protein
MLALFGGSLMWTEPDDVAELPDGGEIHLAGLAIVVDHAPGHTRGSVLSRGNARATRFILDAMLGAQRAAANSDSRSESASPCVRGRGGAAG